MRKEEELEQCIICKQWLPKSAWDGSAFGWDHDGDCWDEAQEQRDRDAHDGQDYSDPESSREEPDPSDADMGDYYGHD